MDNSFSLKVMTPEEEFFEGPAVSVTAPGTLGYLGILKNHAPLVTTVDKGKLSFRDPEGHSRSFKIEGGFLEVLDNRVLVLTENVLSS